MQKREYRTGTELSDRQWQKLSPLLPEPTRSGKGGQVPASNRACLEGLLWLLRSGVRYKDMPHHFPSGNPGMATGGSGDVMTGMIAGLIAQNFSPVFEAVRLAVYLHGLAGDIAAEYLGEESVTATSILDTIPQALKCGAARVQDRKNGELTG